jgi:hypothetical protein
MKKAAWLYSGLPKQVNRGHRWLSPYIKEYDSTVAAHLWSCDEYGNKTYGIKTNKYNKLPTRNFADEIEDFKVIFPTAKLKVEPCSTDLIILPDANFRAELEGFKATRMASRGHIEKALTLDNRKGDSHVRSYYGLLSLKKSFELLPNPDAFDLIIKNRTDSKILARYIPAPFRGEDNSFNTIGIMGDPSRLNDIIYYGNPKIMRIISTTVDHYWDLALQCRTFGVHDLLYTQCVNHSIPINVHGFKLFLKTDMVLR